jgi:hypothetical protein
MTRAALMRRFHVSTPSGELLSGAKAFVHLWSQLAGWHRLARLARLPGVVFLMELAYRLFLLFRPSMQWAHKRFL